MKRTASRSDFFAGASVSSLLFVFIGIGIYDFRTVGLTIPTTIVLVILLVNHINWRD